MTDEKHLVEQEPFVDYQAYFGLSADPFDPGTGTFFQFGKRRDTLSQLLHLCQFSNSLLVVVGESGIGKSSLKLALLEHLDPQDIIINIAVPVLGNADTVLQAIAAEMSSTQSGDHNGAALGTQSYVSAIESFVKSEHSKDQLKLLIIEDAHNLDDASLRILVALAKPDPQNQRQLHIVMFGEPQLSRRVAEYENKSLLIKQFELEPFSKEELKAYLRFRMQSVGFEGIFPFKEEDVQFLWDISHGLPTAVHDAAREILIELATPPPEPKSIGLPVPHMAVLISLIAILLVAVFYRSDDEQVPEVDSAAIAAQTPTDLTTTAETASPQDSMPAVSQDLASENKQLATIEDSSQSIEPTNVSSDGVIEASKPETQTRTMPRIPESSQNATVNQPPAKAPANHTDDERRLLALAPNRFTLQVLVSGSEAGVKEYLLRQPNRAQLATFETQRDGKTVYIVVVGNYATADAAKQAVESLPPEQRQAGPWPRSLESVQADITKSP